MALTSGAWFAFLAAVFLLYWPASRVRALSLALVLFANYFFYARWDLRYLALIPAASTIDFLIALALERSTRSGVRRLLVGASLAMNLGLIAAMKTVAPGGLVFPLSLSFYAFQALTYTLDVYRGDAKPTASLLAHLAAVSFFPTTLSGPITRVSVLLPQLDRRGHSLAPEEGGRALFLIGLGLVKKLAIADYLGANLVDRVFDFPNLYTAAEVLMGVFAYAFQLYYDFSGYTDVAIGSALLLGVKLPPNFQRPYAATSLPEFWRRWHISFSNWLRDYLYFSLPGLRSKSKIVPALNLVITMALGGLWHGLSWNFLTWGLLHGFGLAVTRRWQSTRPKATAPAPAWIRFLCALATFLYVSLAWVFFRAADMNAAWAILTRIASLTVSFANISGPLALVLGLGVAAHHLPRAWYERGLRFYQARPFYVQGAALAGLVLALEYVASTGAAPFIYTRF